MWYVNVLIHVCILNELIHVQLLEQTNMTSCWIGPYEVAIFVG